MKTIDYQEVIDLGFKHIEDYCPVWKKQFGYDYFRVEFTLDKKHYIDWDVEKHFCTINTIDKEQNILFKWETNDINHVKAVINMFTKTKLDLIAKSFIA